jgi:hypothetical protein
MVLENKAFIQPNSQFNRHFTGLEHYFSASSAREKGLQMLAELNRKRCISLGKGTGYGFREGIQIA